MHMGWKDTAVCPNFVPSITDCIISGLVGWRK
jgi:hypothetical protein